jgi:tetratricopeptide (TPR) repeat protein
MENAFDLGNADEAFRQIVQFEDISAHPDYDFVRWRWAMRMKELKGRILMGRGDLEGAEKIARECLDGASQSLARKYVGKAQRLLGQVMTQRGAYGHAEAHLQSALQELERVGNPKQLWITRTALARLYQAMNRADREREHWQAAAAIVRSTAEGLPDASLRHTFLDAAPVREILENEHP